MNRILARKQKIRPTVRHPRLRELQRWHLLWLTLMPGVVMFGALISLYWHRPAYYHAIVFAILWVLTGVGVTVGYHRYFVHGSFKTTRPVGMFLAIFGMMSAQGPLLPWVANHRRHHQHSDHEGDPHSPNLHGTGFWGTIKGLFHAQVGWLDGHDFSNPLYYCRDLLRQEFWRNLDQNYYFIVASGLIIPGIVGGLVGGWVGFVDGLVWAGIVRLFLGQMVISGVNSVCHLFGRRPFATPEKSTNNWLWALPSLGEGWHNNHHAFQTSAFLGLRWWQIDVGGLFIRFLEAVGVIWDVRRIDEEKIRRKLAAA